EMRRYIDRGSATGKHRIECPACTCSFVAGRRADNETKRHVVEVGRNAPLGAFERAKQVAHAEDERYRAIEVGFLGQFSESGDLRHADPARLFQCERNFSCYQGSRERRHFGMSTECESKIDVLAIYELMARRIQLAAEPRRD